MSDDVLLQPCRAIGGYLVHARVEGSDYSLCGHEPTDSSRSTMARAGWSYWPAVELFELRDLIAELTCGHLGPCLRCGAQIDSMTSEEDAE